MKQNKNKMVSRQRSSALLLVVLSIGLVGCCANALNVGSGIFDITGPAAEIGMMGYAMVNQTTAGLHFRLRARAFIFDDGAQRVVYASTDSCMIYTAVKRVVVQLLQAKFGPTLYTQQNVMLSGIHTHSGPGGYSEYLIFDLTSSGFHKDNFNTIASGIAQAIINAHNNMQSSASLYLNSGTLLDSNINRSPTAYANNPASERAKYQHNVDKLMTVLKVLKADKSDFGVVSWFAVHGTSMNNTNKLISGDNKGYASYAFERLMNGNDTLPGIGPFIAAFGQSNEGDVSPNTRGAMCPDMKPCDSVHSTCGGYSQGCHGYGPGKNDNNFESTQIIGTNQFQKALGLYKSATELVVGPVAHVHTFIDMTQVVVTPEFTGLSQNVTTCLSALGDSFAGGTTDGPGDFNFHQGTNSSSTNLYWNYLASFLSDPTAEQRKCQYPKPILLNTGGINLPSPWEPSILPLQIFRIGQLFIIGVPGEFSTMSGRRLRDTVSGVLQKHGIVNSTVVIAGLSNAYSHYITTREEYEVQRYEGASTLYGPNTLAAYQQEYAKLAAALVTGTPVPAGPTPPDLSAYTFTFQLPVIEDNPPLFKHFGDVDVDVKSSYVRGTTASASFWGGNPRNNFLTQNPAGFLSVQKLVGSTWTQVANDGSWDTKMYWERVWLTENRITVSWDIPTYIETGQYRFVHFGYWKSIDGAITPYSGVSSTFTVA
eukprot:TRINITY_DN1191_c0_g1_i1.p1 TRINITY_DN1191_c0_g1~~TRINITY_DN1191_c0_g1_i1.p1  ORF type:complete len:709 (+),score=67.90 TRINITY_DN1191_c0_g1_i1:16-2142(+)